VQVRVDCTKQTRLVRLPAVLCCKWVWECGDGKVYDGRCETATKLDMQKYVVPRAQDDADDGTGPGMFDLAGVIAHSGHGATGGHYVAYQPGGEGSW
jgi:hypothetical protein